VASDSVQGTVTLRLQNVPWDQALDIVLKSKGLDKRQVGNVIMVAPAEEIATRERIEMETHKQVAELAPLRSEFMQVNYAKASELAALIKAEANSLLSPRGNVTVDERTNNLLVQDTADKLAEIRRIVSRLDIPVRQVMIESRIVIASDDFAKDLGVRFGVTGVQDYNEGQVVIGTTGTSSGINDTFVTHGDGSVIDNIRGTGQPYPASVPQSNLQRFNVNLPATPARGTPGSIALALLGADFLVDLELSALQAEGRGEILSNPRIITSDQQEATIKQGKEIPYQEATSSGATSIAFKEAVLELKVTPRITPDNRVILTINVKKDEPDFSRQVLGVPPIDTREVSTEVLLDNGETVVLGGIFEQTKQNSVQRVPFLSDIPVMGNLFKTTARIDNKTELLVFITPKIVRDNAAKR
jgi:type IV pilus assembly protein PilQ